MYGPELFRELYAHNVIRVWSGSPVAEWDGPPP